MADSQKKGGASKGNRLSDAQREANKRKTDARSAKRAAKYEARHQKNLATLANMGAKPILIQRFRNGVPLTDPKTKKPILRSESPSETIARLNRASKETA